MAINRASLAKQLLPGLNAVFGLEYGSVDNEHVKLFEADKSDKSFEEEVLMTGFGNAPVKSEGAAVSYDTASESYTARYEHDTVALAYAITEEAIEDGLYDSVAKLRSKALARAMANTKQIKASNVFNNGFTGGATAGGDGVALFSASHPTMADGNQSNLLTAADISEAALETAIIAIQQMEDDRGILIGAQADFVLVHPNDVFNIERILAGALRQGTADNDINALKSTGFLKGGWMVNRRLTDGDAWFIKTTTPNGTKMFTRKPLQTKMEPDFDTGNLRFKARERYAFGWSDWRGWFGNAGA